MLRDHHVSAQAFIPSEGWRNLSPDRDVPAGDACWRSRKSAMYGMYAQELARENAGTFTGQGLSFRRRGASVRGKQVSIILYYTVQMLADLGARTSGLRDYIA